MKAINLFFDWSEAWALLIPIAFLFFKRNKERYLRPIIIYVLLAFFINLFSDIIAVYISRTPPGVFPQYLHGNSFLYNTHSIVRFACFSHFFLLLNPPFLSQLKKGIQWVGLIFTIVYFSFENFNNSKHISADFLAIEAFLMLIFCLLYFLNQLRDNDYKSLQSPDFYIVLGLSIYVVINFFIFLFYIPMINTDIALANHIWNVHNIAFVVFCIFLAKAFYTPHAAWAKI